MWRTLSKIARWDPARPRSTDDQLADLERRLIKAIPRVVRSTRGGPYYAAFLIWPDTTFKVFDLQVWLAPESDRIQLAAKYPDEPSLVWYVPELCVDEYEIEDRALQRSITEIYDRLLNTPEGQAADDDDVALIKYRQMLWRVARKLNTYPWPDQLNVTEDFVVTVSNASGQWYEADVPASLDEAVKCRLDPACLNFPE